MSDLDSHPRERLISAAITLFYSKSYISVGVQEICSAADVQKGSFYHFFPSKGDLALAALDEMQRQLIEFVFEPAYRETVPPLARVRRQFDRAYRVQHGEHGRSGRTKGSYLGNLSSELSTQDDVIRDRIATLFDELAGWVERALIEAIERGDLPADTDAQETALAILAYFEGVLLLAKAKNDPGLIRRLAPAAIRCLVYKEA